MRVTVISPTIQEFNGQRYYLCGSYFQRKGRRLHREVWEFHNGPTPEGFHIHHRDEDRANNQPENLDLLEKGEHLHRHGRTEARQEYNLMHIERIRPLAAEWHRSPEGREWHRQHGRAVAAGMPQVQMTCEECGKPYETPKDRASMSRFCHQNCRARALRRRRREGKSDPAGGT